MTTEYTVLQAQNPHDERPGMRRHDASLRMQSDKLAERSTQPLTRIGTPGAMTMRGIMKLPHGPLKTWGEPYGARLGRRCGAMTALPEAACNIPSLRGRVANTKGQGQTNDTAAVPGHSAMYAAPTIPRTAVLIFTEYGQSVFSYIVLYIEKERRCVHGKPDQPRPPLTRRYGSERPSTV